MRVLVAYGSKMGGTKGLAEMVGRELESNGLLVDVMPAGTVESIEPYDAVVVGGALYSMRWHTDARRFVRRHQAALASRPVWLFSSGPLDDSALEKAIPPVRFVRKAMKQLGAEGHATFGGRMPEDAEGFPASAMARDQAGDWRDPAQVRDWAKRVGEEILAG